jgi:hypothetical protein
VKPKASASSQIAVSRAPSMRPVASAQAPPATTPAIQVRVTAEATVVTCAVSAQTTRPRVSTRLARRAYSCSTYGRARVVRTSSCPWMASSITAARSDQASSSSIRAGAIRPVGLRSPYASRAVMISIAMPAGHQTPIAMAMESAPTDTLCAIRMPGPRNSEATW